MLRRSATARRRRYLAILCVIAAAAVAATSLLGRTRFFQSLHLKAGDLQSR
jgi:hypothetical protein